MTDTVIYVGALFFLLALAVLFTWDYLQARAGRLTISRWWLDKLQRYGDRPLLWLCVGLAVGLIVGVITGFVLGHLFWPQFLPR
jgi:hypothetical protein